MNNTIRNFFTNSYARNFETRMIPKNVTLNRFYENFVHMLDISTIILEKINNNAEFFFGEQIQSLISSSNLCAISTKFPSEFSFRKLTLVYFISNGNSIIDSCSLLMSFCLYSNYPFEKYVNISQIVDSKLRNYIGLAQIKTNLIISKTVKIDISSTLKNFIREENDFVNNKTKIMCKKYDENKFHCFMCVNCNEHPAATAVLPCGHSYLCINCLMEAMNSDTFGLRCYTCGKPSSEIIKFPMNISD